MIVYKGTDKDMKCRGFQFDLGKEYVEEEAKLCSKGFHGCEYPLDVFSYYSPANSRFFEADLDGVTDEKEDDSKRAGTKIKLRAEIGIAGIVKAAVEYIKEKAESSKNQTGNCSVATNTGTCSVTTNTGDRSAATNTGNCSAATNTGDRSAATNTGNCSAATNTGDRSAATNTGYCSAATNTGYCSAATNTGYCSAAAVDGKESIAIVTGVDSKASGAIGCWLVLTDRGGWNGDTFPIKEVRAVKVDGDTIKPGVFYKLENGEVVEAWTHTLSRIGPSRAGWITTMISRTSARSAAARSTRPFILRTEWSLAVKTVLSGLTPAMRMLTGTLMKHQTDIKEELWRTTFEN